MASTVRFLAALALLLFGHGAGTRDAGGCAPSEEAEQGLSCPLGEGDLRAALLEGLQDESPGVQLLQVRARAELGAAAVSVAAQSGAAGMSQHAVTEAEWNATRVSILQLQDVAGARFPLPAEIAPMLQLLRGLYDSSKQEIAAIGVREQKSKQFFAEKGSEHTRRLAEIDAHASRVSEGFHANETKDETRMWGYWQRVREREHHQFLTFLKIKHGMMQKLKDMIGVYETIVSGNATDAEIRRGIEHVSGGILELPAQSAAAPMFIQEALDKVKARLGTTAVAPSPFALTESEWNSTRAQLLQLKDPPAELVATLEMLKGLYNSSKEQISGLSRREEDSKAYFADKEAHHEARLAEIDARFENHRISEEFRANETRDEMRMWSYWQGVRDHEHRQFLSFLRIKHAMMKKVKDTIDAYERAIAEPPRPSGARGETEQPVVALMQQSGVAAFCRESVGELDAVVRERAGPSPHAPAGAEWRAARAALVQLWGAAASAAGGADLEVPSVAGMLRGAPTEMGPMLLKLRALYNDTLKDIAELDERERKSQGFFAEKEREHRSRVQEIKAKFGEGRLSEDLYANETSQASRAWEHWQAVREHERVEFGSLSQLRRSTVEKLKAMIGVYEEVLAGRVGTAKAVADVAHALGSEPQALAASSLEWRRRSVAQFCEEALGEVRAARRARP